MRTPAVGLSLFAVLLTLFAVSAGAQPYPTKPLRMIIPAGPGGGVDTIARFVGTPLAAALGQPVVMENRPGAGTMIASELVAKSPPDGYTLLMVTNSHVINAGIHRNLRYDPIADFSPVTLVASVPYQVVVHPSVPVATVKELIALAKRRPGDLLAASAGTGSGTHLAFELFAAMAQVNIVHVPYKSGSSAIVDLVGGHVQLMFSNVINSGPHVRAGRLRALAITSARRSKAQPRLPTVSEAALPDYQADVWYGVLLPARTPVELVQRLNREINAILRAPDFLEKAATQGADVMGGTPAELAALMQADLAKWAKVTAKLKLQIE
ncbi:MAG TPA: tripartite tricarboxylate transporter substrate binding protein [Burkholderiales bacterium]|nr:tripartite tricarboxylate transporter substrate binding protein [Burkholderiales bacterium]